MDETLYQRIIRLISEDNQEELKELISKVNSSLVNSDSTVYEELNLSQGVYIKEV